MQGLDVDKQIETVTRLDHWRNREGHTFEALGRLLGVSAQSAFRYCLNPADRQHRRPGKAAGKRLYEVTGGLLHSDNYDELVNAETGEPVLRDEEAAALSAIHREGEAEAGDQTKKGTEPASSGGGAAAQSRTKYQCRTCGRPHVTRVDRCFGCDSTEIDTWVSDRSPPMQEAA